MSDIRFNRWLHQSGTGGVYQDSAGNIGIGTSVPTSALDIQSGTVKIGSNTLSSSGVSTFTTVNATTLTGNLTGNVTGNLTGNVAGNVNAGVITATSSIVVGNSFVKATSIGIGTTTTAGRNAGVGTAYGTMLYNTTVGQLQIYADDNSWYQVASLKRFEATGGTKTNDGTYVRHVFTDPGPATFVVSPTSPTIDQEASILIVGAGGGGGVIGGGGGGGGVITSDDVSFVAGETYNINIGQGGGGGGQGSPGQSGGDTTFSKPSGPWTLTAKGGGGGGSHQTGGTSVSGTPGGSGGGGSDNSASYPYGTGIQPSQNPGFSAFTITQYGNPGSNGSSNYGNTPRTGGAGGGAGASGSGKNGGNGTPSSILGTNYYWGAGGGAGTYSPGGGGGNGGLGAGGGGYDDITPGTPGTNGYNPAPSPFPGAGGIAGDNTGSGGGGGAWSGPHSATRTGGPGIVVIRYPSTV